MPKIANPKANVKPATYIESEEGSGLVPASRARLLFKAWMNHGPGHSEEIRFYVGSSKCGLYDLLWQKTDWVDAEVFTLAWLPKGLLTGKGLYKALLAAYWSAERKTNEWQSPNYDEIIADKKSAISSEDLKKVVRQIWPEIHDY